MIKNHSFCLRKLRFIAVFLLFYPISLLSIQASEKSDMSNVVSNTAQQTSGILSVKKVNPTTVDVLFSNISGGQLIFTERISSVYFRIIREESSVTRKQNLRHRYL